jgi:AcrR family transcriptional regulator
MSSTTKATPKNLLKEPKAADRILTTAGELFYREGTRAVGVDEIVTRAGATKPTLYRAFPSKDHLIAAYLAGQHEGFWEYFEAAVRKNPEDPRAQLLAFFDELGERATRPGYRGCALTNVAVEYPAADHPGRLVSVEHKQGLRERLREMTKAMDARKPKKLADALLLLIEGVYVSSQLFGKDGPAAAARGAAEALIDAHTRKDKPAKDEFPET